MHNINDILGDLRQLQNIDILPIRDIGGVKSALKTKKHAQVYIDVLGLKGKSETALSDYLFKPLMEEEEYLDLRISPQIKAGNGWVDYLIKPHVGNPVAIELKRLHKVEVDSIVHNPLEAEFRQLKADEKNQIKQYLKDFDYVLLTNMKEVYYFNREAIIDFEPFLKEDFLQFVEALRENKDIWDVVRKKEDITPKHELDRKFLVDLKRWYSQFGELAFNYGVNKEEKIVQLLNKFIFLKTLEDYSLIPFNFIRDNYEDKRKKWDTKGRQKVFLEYFEELNRWAYEYYDTELFRDNIMDVIAKDDVNLERLQEAIEKILGFTEWAKTFGIGLTHYNYRDINEDIFGKAYETFLAQERKQRGIFYTPAEITEYMSGVLINELFAAPKERLLLAIEKDDAESAYKALRQITEIKILDPACGSGSFLVKTLRHIWDIYMEIDAKTRWATEITELLEPEHIRASKGLSISIRDKLGVALNGVRAISMIILRHLHGIDMDEKAIDVAKVNIWKEAIKLLPSKFRYSTLPSTSNHILPDLELNFIVADAIVDMPIGECIETIHKYFKDIIVELHQMRDGYLENPYNPVLIEKANMAKWPVRKYLMKTLKEKGFDVPTTPLFLPLEFFYCCFDKDGEPLLNAGFEGVIGNPPWENIKPAVKEFAEGHPEIFGEVSKFSGTRREFDETFEKAVEENPHLKEQWEAYTQKIKALSEFIRGNYRLYGTSGDLSYQKVFLERAIDLTKKGGHVSLLVPSGFHTDEGQRDLRKHIVKNYTLLNLMSFENRGSRWFPDVDSRFKFDALAIRKSSNKESLPVKTRFYIHDIGEIGNPIILNAAEIERFSPSTYGLVEFRTQRDVEVATAIRGEHPLLRDLGYKLLSEFHMTNDSFLFNDKPSKNRLVLYEGKMIHQYEHEFESPRYWVNEKDGRKELLSREIHRINKLLKESEVEEKFTEKDFKEKGFKFDYEDFRLAHRAIARSTDERTLIAMILPPDVFTGNSLNVFKGYSYEIADGEVIQKQRGYGELAYLLALLNSFTLDYYIRLKVSANLNTFFLYELPIPEIEAKLKKEIVRMSVNLLPDDEIFVAFAKKAGVKKEKLTPDKQKSLRAKLEAKIAAEVLGLKKEDVEYILGTFTFGNIDTDLIERIKAARR